LAAEKENRSINLEVINTFAVFTLAVTQRYVRLEALRVDPVRKRFLGTHQNFFDRREGRRGVD